VVHARPQLSRDPLGGGEGLKSSTREVEAFAVRLLGGHRPSDYHGPAGRTLELLAGASCAVLGTGLAVFGAFALSRVLLPTDSPPTISTVVVTLVVCALSGLLLVLAWRLIRNRARPSDGGLLSPFGLRVGGLIFLAGPVAAAFTNPIGLLETGFALGASAACFALARHREHHLARLRPPAA
jgi:hypothetical protein